MKLSVSRDAFLARLGVAVARRLDPQLDPDALRCPHPGRGRGGVELQATDMEIGVRVKVDAEVESAASPVVLPGRLLLDVVRSLPNDDLALEYRSQTQDVEIVSGTARFHLRTLPTEDFPKLPERRRRDDRAGAGAGVHRDGQRAWARAASRDEARPHLTGVLVSRRRQRAADGRHRLVPAGGQGDEARRGARRASSRSTCRCARCRSSRGSRRRTARRRSRSRRSRTRSSSRAGDVVLSSRLIEGRFPNYKQLLPETYEHELRLSRAELLDVVKRISLLAQKNAPLRMKFEDGALEVSAETPDIGEASESLPAPFKGETLEIGFNPEFLTDGLDSAESEELILKLISPHRPGLIQSGDDGGFIYLVMPVRLNV